MTSPQDPNDHPTTPSYSQAETQAGDHSELQHHAPLPTTIGKYSIESLIGQGGMGAVYKAEQDSPRRTVALKVIKAGVASKSLLQRFEIEAQILGKLDHPGIATIYEAGTFDEGHGVQPFFAMEFVQGQELLDYADSNKLGTRDRLALLAKIADAVQHAHQKGIIHRDLKPGNILVNDKGQIKVLDFGVARATDADIQTATMQTDIGQLIGTIPYMSPEQASGNPDDLDTRSDVYALGVIAYELLTGQMPYDLKQKMIHEAVRVIREDEPKTLSSINKTFRGDVEIIVSKALVKEKDRRYQSASDLASDIDRYLNNEPIEARPPSTWYQLSKFSKRNKALVAGVIAVLMVSVAGALISINFAMGEAKQKQIAISAAEDAHAAQHQAQRELERSNEVRRLIREMLSSVRPVQAQGRDTTILTEILNETAQRLESGEVADQLVEAELRSLIGSVYQELSLYEPAEHHLSIAVRIYSSALGDEHEETLVSSTNLANVSNAQAKTNISIPIYERNLEVQRRLHGEYAIYTADTMMNLAHAYRIAGRYNTAGPFYEQTDEVVQRAYGPESPMMMRFRSNYAAFLRETGRYDEAEALLLPTLEIQRRDLGDAHTQTLYTLNELATIYREQDRFEDAAPIAADVYNATREIYGDTNSMTIGTLISHANVLGASGEQQHAKTLFKQAMDAAAESLGISHPHTIIASMNLAYIHALLGEHDEAFATYEIAIKAATDALGAKHPSTIRTRLNRAFLLHSLERYDEAEPELLECIELCKQVLGLEHPLTQIALTNIVSLYQNDGRPELAIPFQNERIEDEPED